MKQILLFVSLLPVSLFAQYFSIHQLVEAQQQPLEFLNTLAWQQSWVVKSQNRGTETTLDNITYLRYTQMSATDTDQAEETLTCYYSNKTSRLLYKVHDKKVFKSLMKEISYMGFRKKDNVFHKNYSKQVFTSPAFILIVEANETVKVRPSYFFTLYNSDDYVTMQSKNNETLVSNR
ncbi:MAG: hypothetical protein ACTHJ5_18115 [Ilyomonas sp.]